MAFPSGEVAIVGVYESPRRKAPGVHPFAIQAECILGALADAGLELGDVDGFATAASFPSEGGLQMSICEVAEYMAIHPRWFDSTDIGGAAFISHAGHAALAIAVRHGRRRGRLATPAAGYSGIPRDPVRRLRHQQRRAGPVRDPLRPVDGIHLRAGRDAATCTSSAPRPSSSPRSRSRRRATRRTTRDASSATRSTVADVLASPMIADAAAPARLLHRAATAAAPS